MQAVTQRSPSFAVGDLGEPCGDLAMQVAVVVIDPAAEFFVGVLGHLSLHAACHAGGDNIRAHRQYALRVSCARCSTGSA